MRRYFQTDYDQDEIKHLKTLAKTFDIIVFVDNLIINDKIQIVLEGDVDKMNNFNKQYKQYLAYRQKLKKK